MKTMVIINGIILLTSLFMHLFLIEPVNVSHNDNVKCEGLVKQLWSL